MQQKQIYMVREICIKNRKRKDRVGVWVVCDVYIYMYTKRGVRSPGRVELGVSTLASGRRPTQIVTSRRQLLH